MALELFAKKLGVDRTDVIAVGDDVNDLAMIKWAGTGVAMPNAAEELVKAADLQLEGESVEDLAVFLRGLVELG